MAFSGGVWGIDIGQCGLKALHGRAGSDGSVVADAFEYIEYPKLLSQQDADRDELIRDAIKTFLERNSLKGDRVAISVSGQSGLARFIKLPPVDEKQLPDLVGYEAKQQIPFDLDDVVWDYQRLPTMGEDEDELQQTEVGLFAMKRDQVLRLIRALVDSEVEIDIVQLMPICTLNAVVHEARLAPDEQGEDANPNAWHVIFSMGTETSDLVLTNGARVWQRSVPIGGNHFTKQLTTDLKLTFAKAEHTKRNAREAPDPRKVFKSMRPVFNDLVTELQRTLGYFRGLEKKADIIDMIVLGNSLKLPGLSQYLEKNLELKVKKPDVLSRLTGSAVTDAPQFKDNILAFPVSYGLVLQGLGLAPIDTNLIPPEILQQRMIRRKKPWIAVTAAALLAAFAFNFSFHWRAWNGVHMRDWEPLQSGVQQVQQRSQTLQQEDGERQNELVRLESLGKSTVGSADGRLLWLELLKAITASLPVDDTLGDSIPTLDERPLRDRQEIFIDSIETEYFPDITQWFTDSVKQKYDEMQRNRLTAQARRAAPQPPDAPGTPDGEPPVEDATDPAVGTDDMVADDRVAEAGILEPTPLEGGAWVIQIKGHHFQHGRSPLKGAQYVREKLLDQLESGSVEFPDGQGGTEVFQVSELGIINPVLIAENLDKNFQIYNPKAHQNTQRSGPVGSEERRRSPWGQRQKGPQKTKEKEKLNVPRYEFTVQFAWQQIPMRQRLENRQTEATDGGTDIAAVSP